MRPGSQKKKYGTCGRWGLDKVGIVQNTELLCQAQKEMLAWFSERNKGLQHPQGETYTLKELTDAQNYLSTATT
jgi:hypothetical protein